MIGSGPDVHMQSLVWYHKLWVAPIVYVTFVPLGMLTLLMMLLFGWAGKFGQILAAIPLGLMFVVWTPLDWIIEKLPKKQYKPKKIKK